MAEVPTAAYFLILKQEVNTGFTAINASKGGTFTKILITILGSATESCQM